MSQIEKLKEEIAELRSELERTQRLLRSEMRQRMVIERYLERLSSRTGWSDRQRRVADLTPTWILFFRPLSVFFKEPFSIWAANEMEQVREDLKRSHEESNEILEQFRRDRDEKAESGTPSRSAKR